MLSTSNRRNGNSVDVLNRTHQNAIENEKRDATVLKMKYGMQNGTKYNDGNKQTKPTKNKNLSRAKFINSIYVLVDYHRS